MSEEEGKAMKDSIPKPKIAWSKDEVEKVLFDLWTAGCDLLVSVVRETTLETLSSSAMTENGAHLMCVRVDLSQTSTAKRK